MISMHQKGKWKFDLKRRRQNVNWLRFRNRLLDGELS